MAKPQVLQLLINDAGASGSIKVAREGAGQEEVALGSAEVESYLVRNQDDRSWKSTDLH